MPQIARPVGPSAQNNAAPFGQESVVGNAPARPRLFLAPQPRTGAPVPEPVLPFSVDMTQGTHSDVNRAFPPKNLGWLSGDVLAHVDAPFTSSMTAGWQPEKPRIFIERPTGWFAREPDVLAAAIEQTIGSHPDSPRVRMPSRGPSFFPWSGTVPPVSPDMVAGVHADQPRLFKIAHGGQQLIVLVDAFSVEMVIGAHPDMSRQRYAPKLEQPTQAHIATFTPATFTSSMTAGSQPERFRQFPPKNAGISLLPSVEVFQSESVIGWHPDTARFFKGPRTVGWYGVELTHVPVPFSPDQAHVQRLDRNRQGILHNAGGVALTPDVQFFSVEFVGNQPSRGRFFSGPRTLGWQVAQTTPQAAVFSVEMIQGSVPPRARLVPVRPPNGPNPVEVPSFLAQWARNSNQYLSQPIDLLLEIQETQEGPFLSSVFLSTVFFTDET